MRAGVTDFLCYNGGRARNDAQHNIRIYKQVGWEWVTKSWDPNRKEHGTSIGQVMWSSVFYSLVWDLGNPEKLQGQNPLYKPIANINGFQRSSKTLRDSTLTKEWFCSHYFLFIPLLKINHSSSKEADENYTKENETLFKGEEIVGIISQQRLIHLHEKDWSNGWLYYMATILLHRHVGEEARLHLNIMSIMLSLHHERGGRRDRRTYFLHQFLLSFY